MYWLKAAGITETVKFPFQYSRNVSTLERENNQNMY